MTVVFTAQSDKIIVMSVDSAVTRSFPKFREYGTGRKWYFYPGVGCISTWGARGHNQVDRFLEGHSISEGTHDIETLADLVRVYLHEVYRPHAIDVDEVGYHVAGFDSERRPRLWRISYVFNHPRPVGKTEPKYEASEHPPPEGGANFHYNGRSDLVNPLVTTVINQLEAGAAVTFDLASPVDLVRLSDFVIRFAAEITPEVGPPFITHVIGRDNRGVQLINREQSPLALEEISSKLREINPIR